MKNSIAIYYGQSGQTLEALTTYLSSQNITIDDIALINLADDRMVQQKYKFPWTVFDFLRAQPESFLGKMNLSHETLSIDVTQFENIIICYPVWFLSPPPPISAFLKSMKPNCLKDKRIITISTCRNMWVEAQVEMNDLVEKLGGKISAHATIEDTAPSKTSLVTTLHFFLSGKKAFNSKKNQTKYGTFGIKAEEYSRLSAWSSKISDVGSDESSLFQFRESLVLAETIGKRISRAIYFPWNVFGKLPLFLQNIYLCFAGVLTVFLILTLMPPTVIFGNLPPFRQFLNKALNRKVKLAAATS